MKRMKKAYVMLLIIWGVVVYSFSSKVKAGDIVSQNILMDVSVNFNQAVKEGRKADIFVSVKNRGKSFGGYIAVKADRGNSDSCIYKKWVEITEGDVSDYEIIIPTEHCSGKIEVQLIDGKKDILVSQDISLSIDKEMQYQYIGTIGRKLDYPEILKKNNLKAISIEMNDIPKESQGLDTIDTLMIDNSKYDKILEMKYSSIKEWNRQGGTIILNGFSEAMRKYLGYGKKKPVTVYDDGAILYKVFKNGEGLVLEWEGTQGIYDCFESNKNRNYILECIKGNISDTKRNQIYREKNASSSDLDNILHNLKDMSSNYFPNIKLNVLLLGIYIIIAGPTLYFVLLKFKRRKRYYVGVVITAVVFGIFIFVINTKTNLQSPYVNYISICKYSTTNQTKEEKTLFDVMLTSDKAGVLSVSNNCSIEMLRNWDSMPDNIWQKSSVSSIVEIIKTNSDTRIKIQNPIYMKSYYFYSSYQETNSGKLNYTMKYKDGKYNGKIENLLGYDLKNVMIVGNYNMVYIGELKDGDTCKISKDKKQDVISADNLKVLLERYLGESKGNVQESTEVLESEAYYYCLKSECISYNNDTFLIGSVDNDNSMNLSQNGIQSKNLSLVVYPIDQVNKRNSSGILLTDIGKYETSKSSSNDKSIEKNEEKDNVICYNFPAQYKVVKLLYNESLNRSRSSDTGIYIYNRKTGQYDEIFKGQDGTKEFKLDAKEYLSSANQLKLKYVSKQYGAYSDTSSLPVLSSYLEVDECLN